MLASAVRRMLDQGAKDGAAAEERAAAIIPATGGLASLVAAGARPAGQRAGVDAASLGNGHGQQSCLGRGAGARADDHDHADQRRDTSHVDASMRPRAEEYQRFIHLVDVFRSIGLAAGQMLAASPFKRRGYRDQLHSAACRT